MVEGTHISETELQEAIRRGEAERRATPHARAVSYDPATRRYAIAMLAGGEIRFSADQVREIANATPEQLANVVLSPAGGAISWPDLDMDISVTGLAMDLIAGEGWPRAYRAMLAREAATVKSEKKAAAARENGRRGGRPRKRTGVAEVARDSK